MQKWHVYQVLFYFNFVDKPLVEQVCAYKSSKQHTADNAVSDITDGRLYKERFQAAT
jgi:hypothetical protein